MNQLYDGQQTVNFPHKKGLTAGYIATMALIELYLVFLFLFGIGRYQGRKINILVSLDLLQNAAYAPTLYRVIGDYLVGVCYMLMLILLIKDTVQFIRWIIATFSGRSHVSFSTSMFWVGNMVVKAYGHVIIFMAVTCFVERYQPNAHEIIAMCVGLFALLLARMWMLALKGYTIEKIFLQLLYMLFPASSVLLMLYTMWNASLQDLNLYVDIWSSIPDKTPLDVLLLLCNQARAILMMIIMLNAIHLVFRYAEYTERVEEYLRPTITGLVVRVGCYTATCILPFFLKGGTIDLFTLGHRFLSCLPLVLSTVSLLLYTFLTLDDGVEQQRI